MRASSILAAATCLLARLALIVSAQLNSPNVTTNSPGARSTSNCPRGFNIAPGGTVDCTRPCRDYYRSCSQWQTPSKCDQLRSQSDFFDSNCPRTCALCEFDEATVNRTSTPLVPALQSLAFLVGQWESSLSLSIRYPTDVYEQSYNEILRIVPTEVLMSETRALHNSNDLRVVQGFLAIHEDQDNLVSLLTTSNEGLNCVEVGAIKDGTLILNMTYMQIFPTLDLAVLPVGGSRLFRREGSNLEMSIIKLDRKQRIGQFTKFFKKTQEYPLF